MNRPYEFDAFYKETRSRLLLQTYALTGDLPASRSAVRDTFVVAWHLWPKISRLPDPESWARPHAWAHAQRRHTARIWHRDKGLDKDAKATLEALAKLPVPQRKALLLTHLASVSMSDLARELGLPRAEAERVLQTATAQFAVHRDVATTNIRPLFEPLREQTENSTWPRPSILRRAGAARRRTHTLVGVGIAVAAVIVSGSLVTDASGVRPTLAREPVADTPAPSASPRPTPEPPEQFSENILLTAAQVSEHLPGRRWTETSTTENTEGNGRVLPCQESRFADPQGHGRAGPRVRHHPAQGRPEGVRHPGDRAVGHPAGRREGVRRPRRLVRRVRRAPCPADLDPAGRRRGGRGHAPRAQEVGPAQLDVRRGHRPHRTDHHDDAVPHDRRWTE